MVRTPRTCSPGSSPRPYGTVRHKGHRGLAQRGFWDHKFRFSETFKLKLPQISRFQFNHSKIPVIEKKKSEKPSGLTLSRSNRTDTAPSTSVPYMSKYLIICTAKMTFFRFSPIPLYFQYQLYGQNLIELSFRPEISQCKYLHLQK
jgi:hypothetical protein